MKSRETLIRLKRFQVDEKRRQVAQIEAMVAEFERMATDLEREITIEQDRAGINDPAHFAYPTYAKAAMQRRDNLKRSASELHGQLVHFGKGHFSAHARKSWAVGVFLDGFLALDFAIHH